MKRYFTIALAAVACLFLRAEEKLGDIKNVGGMDFLLLREFNTPEENSAFQRNVQIMRRYSQVIGAIKKKLETTSEEKGKAALEAKLKQLQDEFKINEQTMRKAYAFATNRNYRLVTLESHICTHISKDELSSMRFADGSPIDPLKTFERNGNVFYRGISISGVKENEEFQRILGSMITRKTESDELRKQLASTTDPTKQLEISKNLSAIEKAIKETDSSMRKKYSVKEKTDYIIEVAKSKLYLMLTPEEAADIQKEKASKK